MKKIFVIIFVLCSVRLFSQGITEQKILSFSKSDNSSIYDFLYDENSDTYIRMVYDTTTETYSLLSNKGNSKNYSYIANYTTIFDSQGNYYVVSGNINGKDSSFGFIIKNGMELCRYDVLSPSLISDGNFIYFEATAKDKSFIVKYDLKKEKLTEGKKYDYITLCNVRKPYIHEPEFSLQLSSSGQLYYVASLNGREFMVINDIEQKSYESIDIFFVTEDNDGNICYIAKDTDSIRTYTVIVQNGTEYVKCYFASGPIVFTKDNIPLYFASDTYNKDEAAHNLYNGNEKGKYYGGEVRDVIVSNSGDIGYIASDTIREDTSCYFIVINGTEGKKYSNIYNLMFTEENEPLFVSEQKGKFFVAGLGKEYRSSYSNIFSLCISPEGKICYIGQNFQDTVQNKEEEFYYHFGEKVFGPYMSVPYSESPLFVFNESWRYAFVAGEYSPTSRDTILYKVHTESFESEGFDYIGEMTFYEGDLFYYVYQGSNNLWSVYRNKVKTGGDFEAINDYKFDKDKGTITFIGLRKNAYYFVRIEL